MSQGQTVFQKTAKIFVEHLIPEIAKSTNFSGIESELDSVLLLADRVLSACQEDLEFSRALAIAEHLNDLNKGEKLPKVAESLLEDMELWLKVILSHVNQNLWQAKRNANYTLAPLIKDLDLLSQSQISLDIDSFHQISDSITQLTFLAYRYRNPLIHSPRDYPDHIKARFLPASLCMLITPIYKYREQLRESFNGFIVSSFSSPKHFDMLSLINSERQKHLTNFRGREDWLQQLFQKLAVLSDKSKPYILLNGYEGMGKSALVAKITERLSVDTQTIGRNAGIVRKNAPWLPNAIVHFGKQSNQPNEIFDIILAQINTLLLEPIDINHGDFAAKEAPRFSYFSPEKSGFGIFEANSSQDVYVSEKPYATIPSQEIKSDPFRSESYDFTRYRRVIYLALKQVVKEKGNIVLIIDAIDEISPDGVNLQFLPESLPVGVSALLSARESKVVKWLENNREVDVIRIKELKKSEIPLFTGIKNEDGEMQVRFNERVWKTSSGWPLMVLEASKLAQDNPEDLDRIHIGKDSLFERRVNEWRSTHIPTSAEALKEILILLSIFESVSPLDLDMIQAFIERNGSKFSRDEIKQMLQLVSSQIEGIDANRIKLALKAFAEYVRDKWLGRRDLLRALDEIVLWLTKKEYDASELFSQFLNFWTSQLQPKEVRESAEKLVDNFIQNKDADILFDIYRGLRKHSKQSSVLAGVMKHCLISSSELGNISAMRTYGWRLVDGTGLEKDVEKGVLWLEKAALAEDIEAKKLLANYYLDGKYVEQSTEIGKKWLLQAVEANDLNAKYIFATRLLEGDGLPQDIHQGEVLLRELADDNYEQAIFALSNRLIEGDVIEQDVEAGEKLLRELGRNNDLAAFVLANLLIDGKILESNVADGEKILRGLAEKGNKDATIVLGSRLHYGKGLQEDVNESLSLLTNLANTGNADAMRILGNVLIMGDKVPVNSEDGKKWLLKAAETDDVISMLTLSEYLLEGEYLPKNLNEGKKWLEKAAETQDSRAMQILGSRLLNGVGLPKNQKEGIRWIKKAIDANNSMAMTIFGSKQLHGEGVDKSLEMGEALLRRAVENDFSEAMRILGSELLNGIALPKNSEEGEKLLRKSVENDNDSAMADLGIYLFDGEVIKQNVLEAKSWLDKAIENNNVNAKVFLGSKLLEGDIIDQDFERGEKLLREASSAGDVQAKRNLGKFLINNKNSEETLSEGINLLNEAVEEDDEIAIFLLASMLFEGTKLPKDEKRGKLLLKKLVKLDNVDGMLTLGNRYLYAEGVEKDIREGLRLLNHALERGEGGAGAALGLYYYQNGNLEMSTMYLVKGVELENENALNNLSFILRRGEAVGYTNEFTIDDLLLGLVEDKKLFSMINYALCLAKGFQCQKDWAKADELVSLLSEADPPAKDALEWWHEYLISKNDDPEGHLVVGWLVRHKLIADPDNLTVAQRMSKAREGGWDVPVWMDAVNSK